MGLRALSRSAHQVTGDGFPSDRISGLFDSIVFTGQFKDVEAVERQAISHLGKPQVSDRDVNFIESRMARPSRSATILERSYS